jgi:hypothetical protein
MLMRVGKVVWHAVCGGSQNMAAGCPALVGAEVMNKIDWRRARARRKTESKYGDGVVLKNGAVTPAIPRDSLARRADQAWCKWKYHLSAADRKLLRDPE